MVQNWIVLLLVRAMTTGIVQCCVHKTRVLPISTIIETLQWRNVFIFHDTDDEAVGKRTVKSLETKHEELLLTVYDVTEMNQTSIYQLFIRLYPTDNTEFHAILVLQTKVINFLKTVDNVDTISNKTTNYETNSKWILLSNTDPGVLDLKLQLKHVIVLYDYQLMIYPFVLMNGTLSKINCLEMTNTDKSNLGVMQCTAIELYPNSNFKMNGRHLLIGTIDGESFKPESIADLADIFAQALNFTFRFVQPTDLKYGGEASGVWDGLVGQLVRTEVDFVLADLTVTKERFEVIDYILPAFFSQSLGVLYLKDVQLANTWYKVFRPLHPYVYACTIGTTLFVGTLMVLLQKREPNEKRQHISDILISLISFVTVRGNGIWPNAGSTRILVSFFWMFCVVITGVYVGNLTAKLSETKIRKPFNSLEELVNLSDWKWGVAGDSLNQKYVQESNAALLKNLWNGIVAFNKTDPTVLNPDPAFHINRLMKPGEKYAFITLDPKYYVLNRNDCLLKSVDGVMSALQIAIGVPKNSFLKSDLEKVMWKLSDNGFLKVLEDTHYKDNRPRCKAVDRIRAVTLSDMKGVLLIGSIGTVLSIIVLVIECIYKR